MRGVARTAVVAGTATAVSNRVSRRQANRWADQEPEQQYPPNQYPPNQYPPNQYPPNQYPPNQYYEPAPPPSAPPVDTVTQLKQLAELKAQGILTPEEFESEKAKVLASSS
jgi:hypothetical protein